MKTRVISAIVAVLFLAGVYFFGRTNGLYVICALASLGCLREFVRLAFKPEETARHLRWIFGVVSVAIFSAVLLSDGAGLLVFTLGAVVFLAMTLMTVQKKDDLPAALYVQTMGLLGFLYCALMPALATRLLQFERGEMWLFGLLAIVFAGDTCAYFVGRVFGKNLLLEAVSPKKTMEGAAGGLIGSALAGLALSYFVPNQPVFAMVAAAMVVGIFAQLGDLFESLLKRVADVKDSGSIMPGHGGFLDRVDGVFFAAPVYYILVRLLAH